MLGLVTMVTSAHRSKRRVRSELRVKRPCSGGCSLVVGIVKSKTVTYWKRVKNCPF